ncbi:prepilin peptidase [Streptomyces sp. NPDC001595]|uniref:A24 family peptidase n=1 Tax=Streptomyces sp. NPDC001532 TaxID=3154520 RepID=UPI003324A608
MNGPVLVAAAALWGAGAGAVLPRAAYRFAVPSESGGRRDACPGGHPVRGWLGAARCGRCAGTAVAAGPEPGSRAVGTAVAAGPLYGPRALPLAAVTALLCAGLAAATGPRPELGVWLLLGPVGVLLTVIDLRVHRLPDALTLPLAAAAPLLLGLAALAPGHAGDWPSALYGALGLGGGYLVLFLVNPAGLGFGDVKLAVGMGAALGWYGWSAVLLGAFAGFLLGALYAGMLVVLGRAGRGTAIAFGPFLLAGAYLGLLSGAGAA